MLSTHKSFELSENVAYKCYFLTDEAQIILSKTEFLEKIIFDTKYIDVVDFSEALAHLCYKNIKLSRKIIKKVLKAISYSNNDDVHRLLVIVSKLVLIKDEFQTIRLEYLFGFPFLMHINGDPCLQYGIKIMDKKNFEEVYQLSTGVDARNHDDALLSLLWKYKGRMESFTLSCLQSLGELLGKDQLILEYFSSIPSLNYKEAYYSDWITPYLKA